MKWSLSQLRSYRDEPLQFDEELDLKHDLMTRYPKDIYDVEAVQVTGYASYDKGNVLISAKVEARLTVPSTRSLTPVALPLAFQMTEIYVPEGTDLKRFDEEDTVIVLPEDEMLDFDVAVEDNILVRIPMQILSEAEQNGEAMPTGQGWEVISEDDLAKQAAEHKTVDPRLAKLKNLFPDQEAKD
ncbi:DNA-binding protein [Lactobacillus sp.] [Lactiplantibacillus mudanjiangensis]|uniref:YceD family protein n=1 Tax=Lactiplantibacillus mudanjiangensis TaxID=1296538 RepID=UPI0010149281|nr:DNA-binding protein [Lactobacillus sp.] [Lactiplantibacillus mudanjiangensis]